MSVLFVMRPLPVKIIVPAFEIAGLAPVLSVPESLSAFACSVTEASLSIDKVPPSQASVITGLFSFDGIIILLSLTGV